MRNLTQEDERAIKRMRLLIETVGSVDSHSSI